MDLKERSKADVEYLTEQEDLHQKLRDGCITNSADYNFHQKLFGIYFRARILAQRDTRPKGEAVGHG